MAVGSNGDNKYNSSHYDEEGMTKCLLEESGPLLLFPKEKRKTVISFVFMAFGFLVNATSIALTHDRVPDREVVLPLPDIFLDNFTQIPQLMFVPDVLVIMSLLMTGSVILLHPHRWILARRTFFIIAVLYLLRSVTMFVTVLPVANKTVYCSPQVKSSSVSLLASRVIELSIGGGMQISGLKKSCGDYIFSGHTVIMVTAMLIVRECKWCGSRKILVLPLVGEVSLTSMTSIFADSPAKFWFLHGISTLTAWGGMGILLLAHGHYTIDVIIGYYASTRMFWTYHVLANNAQLKAAKRWEFYGQAWWFKLFHYFEANVAAPLPKPRVTNLRLPFRFR